LEDSSPVDSVISGSCRFTSDSLDGSEAAIMPFGGRGAAIVIGLIFLLMDSERREVFGGVVGNNLRRQIRGCLLSDSGFKTFNSR
jgi:hypothetical protein